MGQKWYKTTPRRRPDGAFRRPLPVFGCRVFGCLVWVGFSSGLGVRVWIWARFRVRVWVAFGFKTGVRVVGCSVFGLGWSGVRVSVWLGSPLHAHPCADTPLSLWASLPPSSSAWRCRRVCVCVCVCVYVYVCVCMCMCVCVCVMPDLPLIPRMNRTVHPF